MSDCSGDAESSYGGPASPTLVNTPLEELPPAQPTIFTPTPGIPRRLTSAPNAPVPTRENSTSINNLITLGRLSPQSVHSAIATHTLDTATYWSIINGLVITSEAHTHNFEQQCVGEEEKHKKKVDDLKETIELLEAHLISYINTFSQPPAGYTENGQLPHFTIPCSNGLSNLAKWIKKLDNGRVAGYSTEDSPHNLPHVCKIYTSPKYTADPAEPLPHWLHKTLQGLAPGYAALLDVVKDTDNWGLEADVMWYRDLDEHVIHYKAQLNRTHSELKSAIIACDQCRGRLKCARIAEWVSHLAGEPMWMPTNKHA